MEREMEKALLEEVRAMLDTHACFQTDPPLIGVIELRRRLAALPDDGREGPKALRLNWLADQNLSDGEWKRAYFVLAEIAQPRVERLTEALRQLGISEAVISDIVDGRTDIKGRVPEIGR